MHRIALVLPSGGHRSLGVDRAVTVAALAHLAGSPVSLTATAAGEPLYRDLGIRTLAQAGWWL